LKAPKIEVLDVDKQEGEILILPDPDNEVRMDNLRNCEGTPLTSASPWMKTEQQSLAKAVLRYRTADYEATLSLTPRTPLISARTITNVKITSRSIEETVLLNFRIEQAGIRRVVFLVPQHLAKARLQARLLKQKTIEPATSARRAWRDLAAVLGARITQAYAAVEGESQPSLSFTTVQRQQAERAGARITLATTLLVVDQSGTYRAFVQYRVTNATEQFLELMLPAGARLWTAMVAGEPVK